MAEDINGNFLNYFKYDKEKRTITISVSEYYYPKSEFNVDTELEECISTMNRLYGKCDDDRIIYDTNANDEFYFREAIQYIPQKELLGLQQRLEYVKEADEELKVKHQIEILKEVVKEMEDIIN